MCPLIGVLSDRVELGAVQGYFGRGSRTAAQQSLSGVPGVIRGRGPSPATGLGFSVCKGLLSSSISTHRSGSRGSSGTVLVTFDMLGNLLLTHISSKWPNDSNNSNPNCPYGRSASKPRNETCVYRQPLPANKPSRLSGGRAGCSRGSN